MRITARALIVSLLLTGAGLAVTGCQSDKDIDITKLGFDADPPEVLYNQGLANIKAGNMTEAGRKFDADQPAAAVFRVGPQGDGHEHLRQVPPGPQR